jgi:hypothetical protein
VLGITVEQLSNGSFSKAGLIAAVAIGVGSGLVEGAIKILFAVPVNYFLLPMYAFALLQTSEADDQFTCVA